MRMLFKNVRLHNFMSYEDAELALDRHGYILVSGTNNNPIDNAKSNGVGKSSLFSSISWALTGLTMSGGKDVANIYLGGATSVELDFDVDNHTYKVIRTKNPSNLRLFVDGEDKSGKGIRDTEKILNEYLPDVTYILLSSVIILGQGLPQKFTGNSPSGRKDVLEKLSNSDFMITDLKERVSARGTKLKSELREIEDNITDALARNDMLVIQILRARRELENYTEDKLDLHKKTVRLNKTNLSNYKSELDVLSQEIAETEPKVDAARKTLANALSDFTAGKSALELKDTEEVKKTILDVSAQIKSLSREIETLDAVTDVCPTCGQKLPNVQKIDTTDKKQELVHLQECLDTAVLDKDEIEKYNTGILKAYDAAFDTKQSELNALYSELSEELSKLVSARTVCNNNILSCEANIRLAQIEIDSFNKKKEELQTNIRHMQEEANAYSDKSKELEQEADKIKAHIEVNSKMSTILTRDFRGYLLLNVIDFISKQAKKYSMDLFETDKLDFALDGNNILITYDNKDYDMLSGGEKQKVDVIIQLSIRDMLCSFLNFSSNILVLDEITDSLDIVGCQKIFNLISTKLNDVETVYIISHHQDDFEIPYDGQINIVKGVDKISRITTA